VHFSLVFTYTPLNINNI